MSETIIATFCESQLKNNYVVGLKIYWILELSYSLSNQSQGHCTLKFSPQCAI